MIPQLNHRIRVRTPEVYSWFWHQRGKSLPQRALKNGSSGRTRNTEQLIVLTFESTSPPPALRESGTWMTTSIAASCGKEFTTVMLGRENRCPR